MKHESQHSSVDRVIFILIKSRASFKFGRVLLHVCSADSCHSLHSPSLEVDVFAKVFLFRLSIGQYFATLRRARAPLLRDFQFNAKKVCVGEIGADFF